MAKTGWLLNSCNFNAAASDVFDPAITLLISLGTYFLDTPQWDLFSFLMWGAIKYSSQIIFLIIFYLFILSSFNCSMIFITRGNYWFPCTISQPLQNFYTFCFCFRLCFNLIIHWIAAFSDFNNYTMLPKERENYSTANTFMWIKRQRLSISIFGI